MVLGQVREPRNAEVRPVDAVLAECVGGDLHRAGVDLCRPHLREQGVQFGRFRRRAHTGHGVAGDEDGDRADDRGAVAQCREHPVGQIGRRRLPVRSGDSDQLRHRGGPVDGGGDEPEHGAGCFDDEGGDFVEQLPVGLVIAQCFGDDLPAGVVGEDGVDSAPDQLGGELRAVDVRTRQGRVELTG